MKKCEDAYAFVGNRAGPRCEVCSKAKTPLEVRALHEGRLIASLVFSLPGKPEYKMKSRRLALVCSKEAQEQGANLLLAMMIRKASTMTD